MSDPLSHEKAVELVEKIWGSPSLNLAKWADQERQDLKLGFEYNPDATGMDEQEEFTSAVVAATRLVLGHWEQTGTRDRRTAIHMLSMAADRPDDDQFLIGD